MSTFLLVHGAWHGAWCWYKSIPVLQRAGHKVLAPDLPSLGIDRTPITAVTLDMWSPGKPGRFTGTYGRVTGLVDLKLSSMTRLERMLPTTSIARHSRVSSSMTVKHFSC